MAINFGMNSWAIAMYKMWDENGHKHQILTRVNIGWLNGDNKTKLFWSLVRFPKTRKISQKECQWKSKLGITCSLADIFASGT